MVNDLLLVAAGSQTRVYSLFLGARVYSQLQAGGRKREETEGKTEGYELFSESGITLRDQKALALELLLPSGLDFLAAEISFVFQAA